MESEECEVQSVYIDGRLENWERIDQSGEWRVMNGGEWVSGGVESVEWRWENEEQGIVESGEWRVESKMASVEQV